LAIHSFQGTGTPNGLSYSGDATMNNQQRLLGNTAIIGGLLAAMPPNSIVLPRLNSQAQWQGASDYFDQAPTQRLMEENQRLREENERLKNRIQQLEYPVLPFSPIERTKRYRKYT
jgi:hypothetical protein